MVPTQPAAFSTISIAFSLLTVMVPSVLMMVPPLVRGDPLERVTSETFVGVSLPNKAVEVGVFCAFTLLNRFGHRLELIPGCGWAIKAEFLQEVRAVVQDGPVGKPGQSDQPAINGVVLDHGRKVLVGNLLRPILVEVDEVLLEITGLDDVDLEHIKLRRLRLE